MGVHNSDEVGQLLRQHAKERQQMLVKVIRSSPSTFGSRQNKLVSLSSKSKNTSSNQSREQCGYTTQL